MSESKLGPGGIALIVALIAILAASLWFAAGAWLNLSGPPMPRIGSTLLSPLKVKLVP